MERSSRDEMWYEEYRRNDDGTDLIVANAMHDIEDRLRRGRKCDLLKVVAQFCEHLTPEQQLGLAERLPGLLSPEARAALSARLAHAARG